MPRTAQSFECRIVEFFEECSLESAELLVSLLMFKVQKRRKEERADKSLLRTVDREVAKTRNRRGPRKVKEITAAEGFTLEEEDEKQD